MIPIWLLLLIVVGVEVLFLAVDRVHSKPRKDR